MFLRRKIILISLYATIKWKLPPKLSCIIMVLIYWLYENKYWTYNGGSNSSHKNIVLFYVNCNNFTFISQGCSDRYVWFYDCWPGIVIYARLLECKSCSSSFVQNIRYRIKNRCYSRHWNEKSMFVPALYWSRKYFYKTSQMKFLKIFKTRLLPKFFSANCLENIWK